MGIYVETLIRGSLEELWQRTQQPEEHQRWDLRFSSIEYLPREKESQPQRFLYRTRIGLGLTVRGWGETRGEVEGPSGQRTSSLRFGSHDPKSLIREGAGYWQYVPTEEGVRFITDYDYQVRFSLAGRILDRLVFRPLMGWATAWSFDCLRLWIEEGIDPADSRNRSLMHALTRWGVALVWVYQGLVPKLLARHPDELAILTDAGVSPETALMMSQTAGWLEILFGILVLVFWRAGWPFLLTIILMVVATAGVAFASPRYLVAAFNPVSLNFSVLVMAAVGFLARSHLPSAGNCRRRKPEKPQ